MKAVSDNYKLDKRVRLILGLNEENDWKCIERYKETEEIPAISFSPDGNFPCIYAEKTIESIYLKQRYEKDSILFIENISTNNNAINVVPKYCEATIYFDVTKIKDIIPTINKILSNYSYDISIQKIDDFHINLISIGKASHAAHPELGINAISRLIIVLYDLFTYYNIQLDILEYFVKYIGDNFTGKKLGIDYKDESGILTLNTARFFIKDNYLNIGFNLRIPVTINYNIIKKQFDKYCGNSLSVDIARIQEPLYISKDNKLVQQLCNIFNDYNNSNLEPEAIGGGTYARAFNHSISFGPQMPDTEDMCHKCDEFISIENLLFCSKVFAEAIINL